MVKSYKEVGTCGMCKQRFVIEKEKWRELHWPRSYCGNCCEKYVNK